jgi:hypothetical protein
MHQVRRTPRTIFLALSLLAASIAVSLLLLARYGDLLPLTPFQGWTAEQPASNPAAPNDDSPLGQAQQNWANARLSHYRFVLERSCFCGPDARRPVIIEVRDGVTTSITYADDGTAAPRDMYEAYATIDALFARVHDTMQQPGSLTNATFHPELGYPTQATIDNLPGATDDEDYITVRDVEALQ